MAEMRVFGPPGTGKTTYLSHQVELAADKYGTEAVLVASFTRSAAYEISSRIKDLGLERNQVGTLHALCYRALGSPAIAETKIKEFNEWQSIYHLSGDGIDLDEPEQAFETDADKLFAEYQVCRAKLEPRANWPLEVQSFGALWDKWKLEYVYTDFTDMIEDVLANSIPPPGEATVGFFDECFIAGTMVETSDGAIAIEEIAAHPEKRWEILSYVGGGKTLQWGYAAAAYVTPARGLLVRVTHEHGEFICTANHPLWIEGKGWTASGMVQRGDTLSVVWQVNSSRSQVLFAELCASGERAATRTGTRSRTQAQDLRTNESGQNRDPQPDGASRYTSEGIGDAQGARQLLQNRESGWQWETDSSGSTRSLSGTNETLRRASLEPRVCRIQWARVASNGIANLLQNRHSSTIMDGGSRGGWGITSDQGATGTRPAEERTIIRSRVVSIEVLESGNNGRPGCDSSGRDLESVYTLAVTTGNYFANGVLVKNCQDFTPLELALVRMWATHLEYVIMAGDDDQAIYGFKGADPHAFLNPPVDEAHKRVLAQSYRMPAMVHTYSQLWISGIAERESKFFRPRPAIGTVEIRADLLHVDPYKLVSEAAAYADGERKTVMLLASCSYQVAPIVQELRNQGWPFHNPYRRKRGDWNPIRGKADTTTTTQRLLALLRPNTSSDGAWGLESRPWTLQDVRAFMGLLPRTGIVKRGAFKEVEGGPGDQMLDAEMAARVFEDDVLEALLTHPIDFITDHASKDKVKALEYPLTIARKHEPWYLLVEPRIIVGTIHSVKGGEAQGVYVMPDLSRAAVAAGASDTRALDNIRRQMYVAMTRASEDLVLCGPSGSTYVTWPLL